MKKTLLIVVFVFLAVSAMALADTVKVTSQTSFSSPSGSLDSSNTFSFKGVNTITFMVAGKTCNLKGSAAGPVSTGCNYALTVAPNGSISGTLTAGNQVCTQSSQIAASCK